MGRVRANRAAVPDPLEARHVIPALFELCYYVIRLLIWALIINAVVSTLASAGVIDTRNRLVWTVLDFLERVTDPILRPIRNVLPSFGSIDLSPLVAILLLNYVAVPALQTVANGVMYGNWSLL
jgi:YggT family protein